MTPDPFFARGAIMGPTNEIAWPLGGRAAAFVPFTVYLKRLTGSSAQRLAVIYVMSVLSFFVISVACCLLFDLQTASEIRTGLLICVGVLLIAPVVLLIFSFIPYTVHRRSSRRVEIGKNGVRIGGVAFASPHDSDVSFRLSESKRQLTVNANGFSVELKLPDEIRAEDAVAVLEAYFKARCQIE